MTYLSPSFHSLLPGMHSKGMYSLDTFEGFVSVLPTDPCTRGLFCVLPILFFFPEEEICMWNRNGINFPNVSSQQKCICSVSLGLCLSVYFHGEARFSVWTPAEHLITPVQERQFSK